MATLTASELTLTLPSGQPLCTNLSFEVSAGEVLALTGPSGSGKSTILAWLTGTLDPAIRSSGKAYLDKQELTQLATERRRLGLMLQQDYLFPHMTVGQNLLFGLPSGKKNDRWKQVCDSLAAAGLPGLENRNPITLSGGQRARVSLLRTLLSGPEALLLDEPFSRLDSDRRSKIREFTWQSAANLPILLVTHDASDIPPNARTLSLLEHMN